MKTIIKYLGIALVIVGILLVMKNLFAKGNDTFKDKKDEIKYYNATIKLLDNDSKEYVDGAKLVLKDEENKIIAEWTTDKNIYVVENLKNGKYTLTQESTSKYYHKNETGVSFEIRGSNKNVVMYNTKLTEEEIKKVNTTESEVNVDNTASSKSILTTIMSIVLIGYGFNIIYKTKKEM